MMINSCYLILTTLCYLLGFLIASQTLGDHITEARKAVGQPDYFFIKRNLNGYVLDISGASSKSGTPVITYPQKNTDNINSYNNALN
jgi:hypothetical protein